MTEDKRTIQTNGFSVSQSLWTNWKWQVENTIRDLDTFERALDVHFEDTERHRLQETLARFPLAVTPYYLSLIDRENFREDPILNRKSVV